MARAASSRYEKSPRIADKEMGKAKDDVKTQDKTSAAPGDAAPKDTGPMPDRDAGTQDVTVNDGDNGAMNPHAKAMADMQMRQTAEKRDMMKRHMAEMKRVHADFGMGAADGGDEGE